MASLTHLAAGAVCGAVHARMTSSSPVRSIAAGALLGLSPDLDFIPTFMGAGGTPLDHRAMTHSLPFALVVGAALGGWAARGHRMATAGLCALALASHGILDALTRSAPGPQLLWPFTSSPVSFPWQPIPGTDSFHDYFAPEGVPVMAAEALLCVPALLVIAALLAWPRVRRSHISTTVRPPFGANELESS